MWIFLEQMQEEVKIFSARRIEFCWEFTPCCCVNISERFQVFMVRPSSLSGTAVQFSVELFAQ